MIVVEGPDGSGKTTLVQELLGQFPLTLSPRRVSKDAELMVTSMMTWVDEDNAMLGQGMIYDRHGLISEWIYATVLKYPDPEDRGYHDLAWLINANRVFYDKKPTLIYCLPPRKVVLDHHESFPKGTTREQAGQIWDLYAAKAASDVALGVAKIYDYTTNSPRAVVGYVNRREFF